MATRASRTAKPAAAAPVAAAAPAAAPAPAPPAPAAADPPAAAPAIEEAGAEGEKQSRMQLLKVLCIDVSQARCATLIKQTLGDAAVEEEIKGLREALKKAKEGEDAAAVEALQAQLKEKAKSQVRLSSGTPITAAVLMDGMLKGLLQYGMSQAAAGATAGAAPAKKMVVVANFHSAGVEALPHYPLFSNCPAWKGYSPEQEAELEKEKTAANKALKEAREAAKKAAEAAGVPLAKAPRGGAGAGAGAGAGEGDDGAEGHSPASFATYVDNALRSVKQAPEFKAMRVSGRVKEYLSELVTQGIERLANLSCVVVKKMMEVRTMNAEHMKSVVEILMIDAGCSPEAIAAVMAPVDEKLAVYHAHQASEKEKKQEALTDEQKAALAAKASEQAITRGQRQAELAKARSLAAAQRAKELHTKVVELQAAVAAGAPAGVTA